MVTKPAIAHRRGFSYFKAGARILHRLICHREIFRFPVTFLTTLLVLFVPAELRAINGCPDADVSDEILVSNYQLLHDTPIDNGRVEVEIIADIENVAAGSFRGITVTPDLAADDVLVLETVRALTFGPIQPFGGSPGDAAATNLVLRLDQDMLAELTARLAAEDLAVSVEAEENVVLRNGVTVVGWESWMDAFVLALPNVEPVYDPGFQFGFTAVHPQALPVPLPPGLGTAGNDSCSLSPGGDEHWILYDDSSFEWLNVPPAWRNLEILSIERIPLDPDAEDCASSIGAAFEVEIPQVALTDLVESGSFCSGPEHYIDPPVASSRLDSFNGNAISDETSAGNTHPLRFIGALIDGISLSGQIQGYVLKPRLEVRIRPLAGSNDSHVRVAASIDNRLNLAVSATAEQAVGFPPTELTLGSLCFPLPQINLGPLQIPWALQLEHSLGASALLRAGVTIGVEKQFEAGYSMVFDDGVFSYEHCGENPPLDFTPPRLSADSFGIAALWTRFRTSVLLGATYPACDATGFGGPYLDVVLGAGIAELPRTDPGWTLGHQGRLSAGLSLDILGIFTPELSAPLVKLNGIDRGNSTAPPGSGRLSAGTISIVGEDQRWAMSLENIDTNDSAGGFEYPSVAALADGGAAVTSFADITSQNFLLRFDELGRLSWQQKFSDGRQPVAVAARSDGSLIVAGKSSWIAEFAGDGALASARDYFFGDPGGGARRCIVEAMAAFDDPLDGRGAVLAGTMAFGVNEPCAVRVDETGSVLWARVYQRVIGNGENATFEQAGVHAVIRSGDGGFVLAGSERLREPGKTTHPLIFKLDGDGNPLWASRIDAPAGRNGAFQALTEADDGSLYLTGDAGGTIQHDGSLLVSRIEGDGSIGHAALVFPGVVDEPNYLATTDGQSAHDSGYGITTVAGGAVISGTLNPTDKLGEEAWMLRINDRLGVEWFVSFDGPGNDTLVSMANTGEAILAAGVSRSLLPLGTGADDKNSLLLMKLPFEGQPAAMRDDAGLYVRYREPAVAGIGIPEAEFSVRAGIDYAAVDLEVTDLGNIGNLLVSQDTICETRLTPDAGADTVNSPDCHEL